MQSVGYLYQFKIHAFKIHALRKADRTRLWKRVSGAFFFEIGITFLERLGRTEAFVRPPLALYRKL